MQRVVILGHAAAGVPELADRVAAATGLPLVDLAAEHWMPGGAPGPGDWARIQERLAGAERWIMPGDLGAADDLRPRLERADAVVVLDPPRKRAGLRALRRDPDRDRVASSLMGWTHQHAEVIDPAVRRYAPGAKRYLLREPSDVEAFLATARRRAGGGPPLTR